MELGAFPSLFPSLCSTQVEDYFVNILGMIIPEYHQNYWIGLYARNGRPNWVWTDPMAITPNVSDDDSYKHWGVYRVRRRCSGLPCTPPAHVVAPSCGRCGG